MANVPLYIIDLNGNELFRFPDKNDLTIPGVRVKDRFAYLHGLTRPRGGLSSDIR